MGRSRGIILIVAVAIFLNIALSTGNKDWDSFDVEQEQYYSEKEEGYKNWDSFDVEQEQNYSETDEVKCQDDDPLVVCTEYGAIRGFYNYSANGEYIKNYKGIPVAIPPVGDLRYKPLLKAKKWNGTLDASKHGPICMQPPNELSIMAPSEMSEDCIYVNVYTPGNATKYSNLPVMVYLTTTSYQYGSGNTDIHGLQIMVDQGIIVVTINYRLGAFGFLSLGIKELPDNLGLKDIVFILEWNRRNIRAFGGDPKKVTIGGHGTGAATASLLQYSPLANKKLFQRLIMISGNIYSPIIIKTKENSKRLVKSLAQALDYDYKDPHKFFEYIKCLNATELNDATTKVYNSEFSDLTVFGPVIEEDRGDGCAFLTGQPEDLLAEGKVLDVPTAVGFALDEGIFYTRKALELNMMKKIQKNPERLLPADIRYSHVSKKKKNKVLKMIKERYFGDEKFDNDTLEYWTVYATELLYKAPAIKLIDLHLNYLKSPIYFAEYQYIGGHNVYSDAGSIFKGAAHADDIGYIFYTESVKPIVPCSGDSGFSYDITSLWVNFVKYGNPVPTPSRSVPAWPQVTAEKTYLYQVNDTFSVNYQDRPYADVSDFYYSIYDCLYEKY